MRSATAFEVLWEAPLPSFDHKKLIAKIREQDVPPEDGVAFGTWIEAGRHLEHLKANADEDELIVYGSGEYTFIHSIAVPNAVLAKANTNDLLRWSCNPFTSVASYVWGGGRDEVWVERGEHHTGVDCLNYGTQLVFGRTFEGWTGPERDYFEVHQEYAHLAGIHWRKEHQSYCRFNGHGDIEHVVSVAARSGARSDVALVSFLRGPLDEYLAASGYSLVRMFDFTLLRRGNFTSWGDDCEHVIHESADLFYRQRILKGGAAYTRGVQIIRPRRPANRVMDDMKGVFSTTDKGPFVEFLAHDWRNGVVAKVSTDPKATTNYFEASGNRLPFELSPAFFRPEVLLKYKADRDKYTVKDREISCRAAWHLRGFDVNEAGQVHAYICDLRLLPYAEQLHWLSYNEEQKAPISSHSLQSDFKGEFSTEPDPVGDALRIVGRWNDLGVDWWTLRSDDLIEKVTTPYSASRDEWAEAFMDLAKLVIEGFEVKALRARLDALSATHDPKDQSIKLLERLRNHGQPQEDLRQFAALRAVQLIRTKAKGHVVGAEGGQLAQDAIAQHESFANHFRAVCGELIEEMREIEAMLATQAVGD